MNNIIAAQDIELTVSNTALIATGVVIEGTTCNQWDITIASQFGHTETVTVYTRPNETPSANVNAYGRVINIEALRGRLFRRYWNYGGGALAAYREGTNPLWQD